MPEKSTTPDLIEIWDTALDAYARLDVDGMIKLADADAVWEGWASDISLRGAAAIRDFVEEWQTAYDDFVIEIEESRVLKGGITFVVVLQRGRPKGVSGEVHMRSAQVFTWVDGLIVRVDAYTDIDEARAAAERLAEERG